MQNEIVGADSGKHMNGAQVYHLRKLLAWLRCEMGPDADGVVDIVRQIAPAFQEPLTQQQETALVNMYLKAESFPKYIRHSIKMLEKFLE